MKVVMNNARRSNLAEPSDMKKWWEPDEAFDPDQLAAGIKVEMEHTADPNIAKAIAKAHLCELPDYYTRLEVMEEEGFKELANRKTLGHSARIISF